MMGKMSVEQLRGHIAELCELNQIDCNFNAALKADEAWSTYCFREIEVPPITDEISYGVALHEIGHILGRYQLSEVILVRECWAWKWAMRNALEWTSAMQRHSEWCFEYYERSPYARRKNSYEIVQGA